MEPFTRLLFQDLSLEELYQEQGSMLHSLWISGKNNLEITMQDHHQCSGDYVNLTNPPFGIEPHATSTPLFHASVWNTNTFYLRMVVYVQLASPPEMTSL